MAVKYSLGANFILYVGKNERYSIADYLKSSYLFVKLIIADCHLIRSRIHSSITAPFAIGKKMCNFWNRTCDKYCEEMSRERL